MANPVSVKVDGLLQDLQCTPLQMLILLMLNEEDNRGAGPLAVGDIAFRLGVCGACAREALRGLRDLGFVTGS